jgi:hypothetical protein
MILLLGLWQIIFLLQNFHFLYFLIAWMAGEKQKNKNDKNDNNDLFAYTSLIRTTIININFIWIIILNAQFLILFVERLMIDTFFNDMVAVAHLS